MQAQLEHMAICKRFTSAALGSFCHRGQWRLHYMPCSASLFQVFISCFIHALGEHEVALT